MTFLAALALATQLTLSGHLHDGLKALEAKRYDAAIASLTKVLAEEDPQNSFRETALYYRAEAYRAKGDKDKALADWAALLKQARNDQVRGPALAAFTELGGDLKTLRPAVGPKDVWEKFTAASAQADVEAAMALTTGLWRELVMKEAKGSPERLQREFGQKPYQVLEERFGEKNDAGKAWIVVGRQDQTRTITVELSLDAKGSNWLLSSFQKNRGEAPPAPAAVAAVPQAVEPARPVPPEKAEAVRHLIKQLGHEEYSVRNAARAKLQAMGKEIGPVLQEFANATDPEIRAAVRELLGIQ